MGDELCCSRQSQFDIINSNMPETNLINQKNYSKRNIMNNNGMFIDNLEDNEYNNNYFLKKPKFKDYKIQKSQNMYIKPSIKQNYSFRYNRKNKYNNNLKKNNINTFSFEIKGKHNNGVKKKVDKENYQNIKTTYFYNENEVENNNNFIGDNNENENNLNMINNNELKLSYHQNNINSEMNLDFNKKERKKFSESIYSNVEENQENNIINNNNINYNNKVINENQMNNLINDNKNIIENNQTQNYSNNDILKSVSLNQNENNFNNNDIIYDSDNPKDEDEYKQINTEIITNNNNNNNIQQNNNLDVYQNSSIFENIKYTQNNFTNSNIKNNNILPNVNLNQNPTFAPINNINNNNIISYSNNQNQSILMNQNNSKISNNSTNYSKIFENIDTNIANNPTELKKILDIVDSNRNNQNLPDPVLSDEEVDDLIKEAEKTNFKSTITYQNQPKIVNSKYKVYNKKNNVQYQNYKPIVYPNQNVIYQKNPNQNVQYTYPTNIQKRKVIVPTNYNKNGIIQNNVLLTPERKKVTYPLTPDYQIKKNKIIITNPNYNYYNNINNTKYAPILTKTPNKIQYAPFTNPQKKVTNYYNQYNDYTPITSKTPQNTVKYSSPQKVVKANGQSYYLMTPPQNQIKETYIQSPVKVNPPIVQYDEKYFKASPITISKALPTTNNPQTKKIVYYKSSIPTKKVYQHKNIVNQKPSQIIYPTTNNLNPIKNSSKSSFINHSYLNKIQKENKNSVLTTPLPNKIIINQNPYNLNNANNAFNNNNLDLSFTSSLSGLSKTPKRKDKFGNPIYAASVKSSPRRVNNYENYKLKKSFSAKSNDDLSAPIQRRRRNFNDYYNKHNNYLNSPSPIESPLSTPKSIRKINYNMNQFNNNIKRSNINNNLNESTAKVSIFEEDKDSVISVIDSTQAPTGLKIEEHTNQIINKYLYTDMVNPNTFNKGSFNLFYFNSPEFFKIPQTEISGKKKFIYYVNNNPAKQATYEGEVNKLNQKHGFGKVKDDRTIQIGMWRNNTFSGWGRIINSNGQVFEGKFNNSVMSGKGVYKYKDVLYVGDFDNGIRQGKGILYTKNFKYDGQFNQGKIDGYGKIVFLEPNSEECEYEGFFKNNKIEGNGLMKWRNGNMYQGEMKNGKMNGRGRFIPKNGVPLDGFFKDNIKVNA